MVEREKAWRTPLLLLMCISCLIFMPSLIYPYGKDQGIFGYAGHLVLKGGVPFKDFWDPKPPALYYIYGMAELLFGYSMSAIRWLDLFWQMATILLLYRITRRLSGSDLTSFMAGLIYALAYISRGWWNTAQPDDFLNLPLSLAVFLFLISMDREGAFCLSLAIGILAGVAFYLKYPMGGMLAVFMVVTVAQKGVNRRALSTLASMALGFVLLAGGYALYLYLSGAWGEFFYAEFVWVREYTKVISSPSNLSGLLHLREIFDSHFSFVSLIFLSLLSYGYAIKRGRCNLRTNLIALWALTALVNLYLQNKFYLYHFAPLVAPLSIGAAFAVAFPFNRRNPAVLRRAVALVIFLIIALSVLIVNRRYNVYCFRLYGDSVKALSAKFLKGKGLQDYYMNIRFTSDDFSLPANLAVADYIARNTQEDGTIFIWGYETIIYYLAGRRSASRFFHNFPLRCEWVPDRFGNELLSSLSQERPKYFLIVRNDPAWWATGTREDSEMSLKRYPGIQKFISDNYIFDRAIEDFLIFKRRGGVREGRDEQKI